MDRSGTTTVVATALFAAAGVSACARDTPAAEVRRSPPWVVCGTTLWDGHAPLTVTDATQPGQKVAVRSTTGDGTILALRTSATCDHGARITVDSRDAGMQGQVSALDGGTAALLVQPQSGRFTITVEHRRARPTIVEVDIPTPTTPAG